MCIKSASTLLYILESRSMPISTPFYPISLVCKYSKMPYECACTSTRLPMPWNHHLGRIPSLNFPYYRFFQWFNIKKYILNIVNNKSKLKQNHFFKLHILSSPSNPWKPRTKPLKNNLEDNPSTQNPKPNPEVNNKPEENPTT